MTEKELIYELNNTKNALLLEPSYKRKYIPMGLGKIANYFRKINKPFIFRRSCPNETDFSHIYITSLFTYDSAIVLDEISKAYSKFPYSKIIIGGVYATLLPNSILKKFKNVFIFKGCSPFLDSQGIDYDTNWFIKEKWKDFSFIFTSRGCPNNCKYCAVKKLENRYIIEDWKEQICSEKPYIMIFDNNLSSVSRIHVEDIIVYLYKQNKKVIFDNGFDCKFIDDDFAKSLSKINIINSGLRIAFDRMEDDIIFQKAVRLLIDNGIHKRKIMSYVLFNFNDCPQEANYRMEECKKLEIRPYPQKFIPLNCLSRTHFVSKYWTKNLLKEFRFFWLMAGYYTKMTFEEYAKLKGTLKKDDWEKFYYKKN